LEKALGYGIIMTISSATHTAFESIHFYEMIPVMAGVLTALIWMNNDLFFWVALPYRH